MPRIGSVAACALAIAGCTSIEDVRDEHAYEMGELLRQLAAVRADMAARPVIDADAEPDTIDGTGLVFYRAPDPSDALFNRPPPPLGNIAIVYEDDLARPGEMTHIPVRVKADDFLPRCAALAQHGTLPWNPDAPKQWLTELDPEAVEETLVACTRITHVLVLRAAAYARPIPPTHIPHPLQFCDAPDDCKFEGGFIAVDVHLYALAPLVHRAAFRVEATSDEKVSAYESSSAPAGSAASYIELDFQAALPTALRSAIRERMKGARGGP